jgi:hypothetical protein
VRVIIGFIALLYLAPVTSAWAGGLQVIPDSHWTESAVRKVLHTFAYGSFASDQQIKLWAQMAPNDAIQEMLTFDAVNEKLSPVVDASGLNGGSLAGLQTLWGDESNPDNPVFPTRSRYFSLTTTNTNNGTTRLNRNNLPNAWVQAVNTRGINPFLHKVGMYLTNYHMAMDIDRTQAALMRDFYDQAILGLRQGMSLTEILAQGASSATIAFGYRHQYNRYNNNIQRFYGNDDFAREFHQLFFKIQGTSEPEPGYHENTTIEHTAWALTGTRLDRVSGAYGSTSASDWWVSPINFTDHPDPYTGNIYYNQSNHYNGCLEILRSIICGANLQEKINNLATVAGNHPESLENIPIAIVVFFGDSEVFVSGKDFTGRANSIRNKVAKIREEWATQVPDKDLLAFLRTYATSKSFHNSKRIKFLSSFDRNLTIQNLNTLSNEESFVRYEHASPQMKQEGAIVFSPAHDVFGGQTGTEAANNPNIFRDAYQRNVTKPDFLGKERRTYPDGSGRVWIKDWASVIPIGPDNNYNVAYVTEWLWKYFTADNGVNLDVIAKAQVQSLLASGYDFGWTVNQALGYPPEQSYSSAEISVSPLLEIDSANAATLMDLASQDPVARRTANEHIGMAVNFITVLPYTFAMEGK